MRCKARGSFRKLGITPVIGDRVLFSDKLYLEKVLPRTSLLVRPPVANADQAILVIAAHTPEPNLTLLDRFLAQTMEQRIHPVLCCNKWDLVLPDDPIKGVLEEYKKAGFTVLTASTITGEGLDAVKTQLTGRINIFAGPSGVGKSSLMNCLVPGAEQKIGDLSEKIQRGKNTTRHAKLIPLPDGGFAADTPGFTSLYLGHLKYQELEQYYPEFQEYRGLCRFRGCSHVTEPDCAVRAAVEEGQISKLRYENYVALYREIKEDNEEHQYE